MLNFVLCDDNLQMLEKLSEILKTIFSRKRYDANISFVTSDATQMMNYIETNSFEVIFLDIDLNSKISGLEIAKAIRNKNKETYIIFITSHLEYSLLAYKYKAFDFLPKPVTLTALQDTITRLFEDINGLPKKYLKIDKKNTIVDENSVQYIKRDGMKLVFHSSTKDYEAYSSFNKIKNYLPNNFVRCHKSYIVNLNLIKDVDPVINTISFSSDSSCDIGPKYKKDFMEVLNSYGNIK